MFGIADKAVDRLQDVVISYQAHIKQLEIELFHTNMQLEQLGMTRFTSLLRASRTNPKHSRKNLSSKDKF